MSIDAAKKLILDSFERNSDIGTIFDFRYVLQNGWRLGVEQDDVKQAVDALYAEGILTSEGHLTEQGFSYLFPSNPAGVRQRLLSELRSQRLRVNDSVDGKSLFQNFMIHLNTQERKDLEQVLINLTLEGVLENRNGNLILLKLV